ncbi:MAG: ribonuclease P [Nanoarchaeota archaeon]
MKPQQKSKERAIARERIHTLFEEAAVISSNRIDLANRYVQLARNISTRFNVRIPALYKRRFCKHCYHYLISGINARIRTRKGTVIITCFSCKKYTRIKN